ncbi:MAG: OmpA family protein [Alphaproteobacteria bacterium]|nr:OmpA family protein [Alphaproteobacteria bacterium]
MPAVRAVARGASARRGLVGALALVSSTALAQQGPVSADPEYVHPRFGADAVPGVPVAKADVRNTVRWGLILQYERNPVTGYRLDQEVGVIVGNRLGAHLGVSWDFAEWGTARAVIPMAVNWQSQFPEFAAEGFGMGDISLGLQFLPFRSKHFNLGLYGDVWFPSGRSQAYMGDPGVRGTGGVQLLGMVGIADMVTMDVVGNVGIVGRQVVDTRQDFDHGPELNVSEALRFRLAWLPVPVAIVQALVTRIGLTAPFQGAAENGLELYGGVQVPVEIAFNTTMTVDVMAGRGATQGYGTTDLRVIAGLTFLRNPGRKPRPEVVEIIRPPPVLPPPVEEAVAEDPPEVQRLADQIVIRDPIEFFVDTANIKPESLPLLQKVADVINEDARIKHLVIEGHASEEGTYEYNYELSKSRAESIYKQLILNGVAPRRLSYRGMGEVVPKVQGNDEEAWKFNRRVEFHIVAQYDENTLEWPDYGQSTQLPWTGDTSRVVTPKSPDEIEREELRKFYEEQRKQQARDNFEEPAGDGEEIEVEGAPAPETPAPETPAPDAAAPEGAAEPAPAPEQPAPPPAEPEPEPEPAFDEGDEEEFEFEGRPAEPAPEGDTVEQPQ